MVGERRNINPQTGHGSSGLACEFGRPVIAAPVSRLAHAFEQVRLRSACSLVWQGKGVEQGPHVFQNGYTRLAFPCCFLSFLEYVASISFNKAAMLSGDELV